MITCTFCSGEITYFSRERKNTVWPACKVHTKLENKYSINTPHGLKLSKGGILKARATGVDESIIMLYSQQSSTIQIEKSTRRRTGGSTKSESKYLTQNPRHLTEKYSAGFQDVSSNLAEVQQHRGEKPIEGLGSSGIREGKDEPY